MERKTNMVKDVKSGFELGDHRGEKIHMVTFQGSEFHGVDMRNNSFEHVNFVGSKWQHIYFADVHINGTQMGGTKFENISRPKAEKSQFIEEPGTEGWINVEPVQFVTCDLSTAVFDRCNLKDVELRDCDIEGLTVDGVNIKELIARYRTDVE